MLSSNILSSNIQSIEHRAIELNETNELIYDRIGVEPTLYRIDSSINTNYCHHGSYGDNRGYTELYVFDIKKALDSNTDSEATIRLRVSNCDASLNWPVDALQKLRVPCHKPLTIECDHDHLFSVLFFVYLPQ